MTEPQLFSGSLTLVPWHKSKGQDFSPDFQFVGFCFSLRDRSVTISDEKRLKNKGRVDSALAMFSRACMGLKDIQKLFGSLSHLAFVYLSMRLYALLLAASFTIRVLVLRKPARLPFSTSLCYLFAARMGGCVVSAIPIS